MKIYRIAQNNSGLYYHGSKEMEKVPSPRDFPGVFFAPDPERASKWGSNVAAYRINAQNFFKPNVTSQRIDQSDFNILERFIENYGYKPSSNLNKTWVDMGATQNKINSLTVENYYDILGQVLLFPTKEWVNYLRELGYAGTINYDDLFLIDLSKAQYVGQYDFKKKMVINK